MPTLPGMETAAITSWTLAQEIPVPPDVTPLLVQGEQAVAAFKTFRDSLATGGSGTLERRLGDAKLRDRVFAKTGYISGVRALSGYVLGGKRRLAFSILMTDCVYSRECQDEIVKLLAAA